MEIGSQPDLAHRLQAWVAQNKSFLVLVLIGGIAFFGILAGGTVWLQRQEEKAGRERLERVEKALAAKEAKNWDECIQHYEALYAESKHSPFFRVLALHGIGTCQREAGRLEAAAQTFERAALEPGHVDPSVSQEEAKKSLEPAEKANEDQKKQ